MRGVSSLQFKSNIQSINQTLQRQNQKKMQQLKFLLICAIVGNAVTQRGHYAGSGRPILGSRYQNMDATAAAPAQSNLNTQSQPAASNTPNQTPNIAPATNNFVAPSQAFSGNRLPNQINNQNQINSNQFGNNRFNKNQFRPRGGFSDELSGEFDGFYGGFPQHGGFPGFGFQPHGQFGPHPHFHRR